MNRTQVGTAFAMTAAVAATFALAMQFAPQSTEAAPGTSLPKFEADPYWPKPLPNNWILGEVSGVSVDSRDHVWIIHRPAPPANMIATRPTAKAIAACPRPP